MGGDRGRLKLCDIVHLLYLGVVRVGCLVCAIWPMAETAEDQFTLSQTFDSAVWHLNVPDVAGRNFLDAKQASRHGPGGLSRADIIRKAFRHFSLQLFLSLFLFLLPSLFAQRIAKELPNRQFTARWTRHDRMLLGKVTSTSTSVGIHQLITLQSPDALFTEDCRKARPQKHSQPLTLSDLHPLSWPLAVCTPARTLHCSGHTPTRSPRHFECRAWRRETRI